MATAFYGTENDTYYITALGRIWHVQSADGGKVNEVDALPSDVEKLDSEVCHDVDLSDTSADEDEETAGSYVQVIGSDDGWGVEVTEAEHDAALDRMQGYLDEHEPVGISASVRSIRRGEIAAIYSVRANGNEQILGHSIPVPDLVGDLYQQAWQHALDTWPRDDDTE